MPEAIVSRILRLPGYGAYAWEADEVTGVLWLSIRQTTAVLHQGATPVFADVDPVTYNLDPADAARRVTPCTRAIVPVHLHGLSADMDAIRGAQGALGGVVGRFHPRDIDEDPQSRSQRQGTRESRAPKRKALG